MLEKVLFLHKKEATEVNANQHQGATRLREMQFQVNMDSYIGTLIYLHAIAMENFLINAHTTSQK